MAQSRQRRAGRGALPRLACYSPEVPGPVAPCRLCGNVRELVDSHVIPAWSYERAKRGPEGRQNNLVLLDGVNKSQVYAPRQISEHLLCRECEDLLAVPENYVSQLLFQDDGSFPLLERLPGGESDRVVPLPGDVDVESLAHFAYGVIWRGSVCSELKTKLGPYEQRFADYLLGRSGIPRRTSAIVKLISEPKLQRTLIPPQSERFQRCEKHYFLVCGAVFLIFVGGRIPSALCAGHFPSERVALVGTGDDVLSMAAPLFGHPAKGKLARDVARGTIGNRRSG